MTIKTRENSSKRTVLLYAGIWGVLVFVLTGLRAFADDIPAAPDAAIRSVEDPFDVQVRAPALVDSFLAGVAQIKRQLQEQEKPPEPPPPVLHPVVVPKEEPLKRKKLNIPEIKVTGLVYNSDKPLAIINGKVVGVGGIVDGVTIVKIQIGKIDAMFDDSEITIKFNNP